jgi:hypothetical protein
MASLPCSESTVQDIENGVRRVPLREDGLVLFIGRYGPSPIYGVEKGFKFEFPLSSSSRFHVEVPRPSRNGSLCHPHCHIAGRANGMCRAGSRDLFWLIGKTLSRAAPWLSMLRFITFTGRVSKDIFLINVVIATAANVQIEFGHRMSALGQKQPQKAMSALPPIATAKADFPPKVHDFPQSNKSSNDGGPRATRPIQWMNAC